MGSCPRGGGVGDEKGQTSKAHGAEGRERGARAGGCARGGAQSGGRARECMRSACSQHMSTPTCLFWLRCRLAATGTCARAVLFSGEWRAPVRRVRHHRDPQVAMQHDPVQCMRPPKRQAQSRARLGDGPDGGAPRAAGGWDGPGAGDAAERPRRPRRRVLARRERPAAARGAPRHWRDDEVGGAVGGGQADGRGDGMCGDAGGGGGARGGGGGQGRDRGLFRRE